MWNRKLRRTIRDALLNVFVSSLKAKVPPKRNVKIELIFLN